MCESQWAPHQLCHRRNEVSRLTLDPLVLAEPRRTFPSTSLLTHLAFRRALDLVRFCLVIVALEFLLV